MRAAVRSGGRWKAALLVGAGVLLYVFTASAADPASAEAQLPFPNPIDGVKSLLGGAADAVTGLGADVLKEALDWLLGGLKATVTLPLIKFLTTIELPVGGTLKDATGPIVVIGGFFLVVGLITSIGDGYREIVAGTDTAPRVIGQAIFRVVGLAVLLGSWFWLVPLAVDVANGMSGYVLSDEAVASALRRTFASQSLLQLGFPLLGLLIGIFLAMGILMLVVLKFVIAIAFACLYVGGPALIGFAALPRVGRLPLAIATRGLVTLMLIPLAWTVVFVAWAGVSAGIFDAATGAGSGVVNALMGPGLFLAGLVVMLAVTKQVLSMASFGLPLSVPGAGILRMAAIRAAQSAAAGGSAAGAAGKAAEQGGSRVKGPTVGGEGPPIAANTSTPQPNAHAASASQHTTGAQKGKLNVGGATASSPATKQEQQVTEEWRREKNWQAKLDRKTGSVAAIADLDDGAYRGGRRLSPADLEHLEAMQEQVHDLKVTWGEPTSDSLAEAESGDTPGPTVGPAPARPTAAGRPAEGIPIERLHEVKRNMQWGDGSAMGRLAINLNDRVRRGELSPAAARSAFQRGMLEQYAGKKMEPFEQEAIVTFAAAGPEKAETLLREDVNWNRLREPEGGQAPGHDPGLSNFHSPRGSK